MRVILLLGLCAFVACTDAPGPADAESPAAPALAPFKVSTHPAGTAGAGLNPAVVFACRSQCWRDVPFNRCKTQRDRCIKNASSDAHKEQCREMSRTCRKVRSNCLHTCTKTGQPPLATDALKLDGTHDDDEADEPADVAN